MYKRNAEEPGVVSERELPIETSPAPALGSVSGSSVAVIERPRVQVPAPATTSEFVGAAPTKSLADETEVVRAHPGNTFWIGMTGAAVVLAAASLLVAVVGIVA
jgi:hypothetical protein